MKNLSTGTGLALLAGAIVAFPFVNRVSGIDKSAQAAPPVETAKAVSAAATAQVTPTVVWYGVANVGTTARMQVFRAWSDGRIEVTEGSYYCASSVPGRWDRTCASATPWTLVADPNQGYNAASDVNFDGKVDGTDLGQLLAAWGDAPRHDISPSDCPLNLVNP
jgi:hypothetical protein